MNTTQIDKLLNEKLIFDKAGIAESMLVADLGCGRFGHFSFLAADLVGKNGKVYAVDILKSSLESVKRKAHAENRHNIIPVWSNLEVFRGTQIEVGSLDLVLLINTLHQSKHRAEIIREVMRLLKKGGNILIVEWNKTVLPFGPIPEDRVDDKNIIKVAQKQGLHLADEFRAGKYHYGLIFNKL